MAGVDDRRFDVKDILDRATYGWVTPPNKPLLIVEGTAGTAGDRPAVRGDFIGESKGSIADGVIFIKKDYTYNRDKLTPLHETVVWEFSCIVIAESNILLQGIFDQMREVFDRYTNPSANTPFSTSTLGTSTTYDEALIDSGTVDIRKQYVMDVTVFLKETVRDVKIA